MSWHGLCALLALISLTIATVSTSAETPTDPSPRAGFSCGPYRCVLLYAGQFDIPVSEVYPSAPADVLAAALQRYNLPGEKFTFRIHSLFIDTGKNRVIVDPGGIDDSGTLLASARDAGIDPAGIDTVVITHGHFDHFRGGVLKDGTPAFPNAKYVLQKAEWEHWIKPDNPEPHLAQGFRSLLVPLRDRFTLMEGEGEIVPGIRALSAPGHSPAHVAVLIGSRVLCTGDVLLTPIHIEHPEWPANFDRWPDQVIETRHKILNRIIRDKLLVVTTHFTPPTGRVFTADKGMHWNSEKPE